MFRNIVRFYAEELLVSRPNPTLEDHPLSAVLECFFFSIDSQLPFISGGRPPISNDVTPVLCIGTQF